MNYNNDHYVKISIKQMETITDNHNWTQCRDQGIVESLAPTDTSTPRLLHLWIKEDHGREGRKIVKVRIPGSLL